LYCIADVGEATLNSPILASVVLRISVSPQQSNPGRDRGIGSLTAGLLTIQSLAYGYFNGFEEVVATSGKGLDGARLLRRVVQRMPQALDSVINSVIEIQKSAKSGEIDPEA
jgi:hypothetical protein